MRMTIGPILIEPNGEDSRPNKCPFLELLAVVWSCQCQRAGQSARRPAKGVGEHEMNKDVCVCVKAERFDENRIKTSKGLLKTLCYGHQGKKVLAWLL